MYCSGMPLIRQSYNACGPASITQVLGYFGLRVNMTDVSHLTRPTERSYMTAQAIVDLMHGKKPTHVVNGDVFQSAALRMKLK